MQKIKDFFSQKGNKVTGIIVLAVVLLSIPITYTLLQQNQDTRQHADYTPLQNFFSWRLSPTPTRNAPTPTPSTNSPSVQTVCSSKPVDTVLVIDTSGSMTSQKLSKAKQAATSFVDILAKDTNNKVALVSFADKGTVISPLTNNFNEVKQKISTLTARGSTCAECGIKRANEEIAKVQDNQKKAVVFLTDGKANSVDNPTRTFGSLFGGGNASTQEAENQALAAVQAGYTASKTLFYSIGLGSDVNANFLKEIAQKTGGEYYYSPTETQLNTIYDTISQIIGKGSISGSVFHDKNGNKIKDTDEEKLPDWTLKLTNKQNNQTETTIKTNETGDFSITGICDGQYSLSEEVKAGWTVTTPVGNQQTITISNAEAKKDILFGNKEGTQTTLVKVAVMLPGIGEEGNTNPVHASRSATLQLFNTSNQKKLDKEVQMTFDGKQYNATVDVTGLIQPGVYYAKIKMPNSLSKTIPGVQTVTSGTTATFPTVTLTTGDINNDNALDIVDFNLFISCIGVKVCPEKDKANLNDDLKDLNDNGQAESNVDGIDYNILLRAFASREGY